MSKPFLIVLIPLKDIDHSSKLTLTNKIQSSGLFCFKFIILSYNQYLLREF